MSSKKLRLQKTFSRNKTLFSEVKQEFQRKQENLNKTFEFGDFLIKNECTSFLFGKEKVEQKGYICFQCDKKGKYYLCDYCYKNCHQKCRKSSKEDEKYFLEKEFFNIQRFACFCGLYLKHTFEDVKNKIKVSCTMMKLDQILGITPYHCISHNLIICCICEVVCHKNCKVEKINEIDNELTCECKSNFHSNFNELALSFPLDQYKKVANIDIWPIQILNILFSTKTTFNKMALFFHRALNNEIDFKNINNIPIINKFELLLELFSDSFNRKFKTYYYHEEMSNMFPLENLFNLIKIMEVTNGQTAIIKFRLLFILLFIHLRKDFNTIKSFTSNDFYCNTVLQRLKFKKILKSNIIFSYNINEKYQFNQNSPVKTFALLGICNLITKGMYFVSVEENQDEFEIGLKLITFMLKRMIFDKNDIILLIDSIYDFHSNFYNYIMSEKNNIYSLIDIFNGIIEICFIISVYYNDLIIEEYLEGKSSDKIGKFIHTKSEHSNKLLTILLKNCDLFSTHFKILIKPNLDKKNKEEIRRENNMRKHKLAMQNHISSRTTGVSTKMPENGGLFTDKIINLFIENLSMFSLADNFYQKQLNNITNEDINQYYIFCKKIKNKSFYEVMNIEQGKHHSNILYNLKIVIEEIYYDLFTSSYIKQQDNLENRLKEALLNSCDEISNNIENFKNKPYYKKLIHKFLKKEKKNKKNENYVMTEEEALKKKLLKEISKSLSLTKSHFLSIDEGRELIIDNLIISQIDEILFKGMFLLSNIHYPNIISSDLIQLFFRFLSLFLLTKRGTIYIVTGKNLQVIQRLINRFRFDEKNKNINEEKNRTEDFNIRSIKIVIHFLNHLTKAIKIYDIKTLKGHKVLMKYRKSIITHLKYFSNNLRTEKKELEFKKQLKESLEIFNNLFPFYTYNEFEIIKTDVIELFRNSHYKFLNSELFLNLFDLSILNKDQAFLKNRNLEVAYYFQFLELVTKNSFYVYNNDENGKKLINAILEFIDINALEKVLIESSNMISYTQKIVLLKFIRTYYLIDYLDQVNFLYKEDQLTNNDYKLMIINELIKDSKVIKYLDISLKNNNKNKNYFAWRNKEKLKYIRKYELINELIVLLNIFGNQIDNFPHSIYNETNACIKNYINELIFSVHEISNSIYYNKNITNKLLPYYYRLAIKFLNRKDVFLKVLKDIDNGKEKINSNEYEYLIITENRNKDYKFIVNNKFVISDIKELFSRVIKNIYDIYKRTKIDEEFSLSKYLEIYDIFNEANFPPFSLLEIKDYEYFYEKEEEKHINNIKNSNINRLDKINNEFLKQFKHISTTSFLGVLTGDSTDKKFDFGYNFTELFESFINSTESDNLKNYRALLCILDKMLFYDCSHFQSLFTEMIYDKNFFNNINRELNYYIVKYIDSAKRHELCRLCVEITDITKLTIQFLQLLGEGFNTNFHENILKQLSEKRRLIRKNTLIRKGTIAIKESDLDEESNSELEYNEGEILINNALVEKSIQFSIKELMNKIKNVPLIDPDETIYETMIHNLKNIFYLMELNYHIEGELSFDKLVILSTNIIDFLIEYIDTKNSFIDIIDTNITNLFFGNNNKIKIKNDQKEYNYEYIQHKGILKIFTMKIENNKEEEIQENNEDSDNEEDNAVNKYKLRKTMLAYMKIKYLQLLKSYILLGNKEDFVKLLIKKRLGPLILFEEVLYYISELINNLIEKDYKKYQYLLEVNNVNLYYKKLKHLYKYEDDFRASIEINLIFKICVIIKIMEDTYGITMLKDYYENEQFNKISNEDKFKKFEKEEKSEEKKHSKNKVIKEEREKEVKENKFIKTNENINNIDKNEEINKYIIKDKKETENDNKITINNNTNNINSTISPLRPKLNYLSTFNTNTKDNININQNEDNNNIITLKENPKHKKYKKEFDLNKTLYKNIFKYYKKLIKEKIEKEKEKKGKKLLKNNLKLEKENLNLNSIFAISVYKFLFSLILKVEIKSEFESNLNKVRRKINLKKIGITKISNDISKSLINTKNKDFFLSQRSANQNFDLFEEDIKHIDYNIGKIKLLDEKKEETKVTFFIKPYLSFHMSKQTKELFLNKVDRSSAKGKYKALIIFSDYCIFEMMYNMKFLNNSKILKKFSKINFFYLHLVNYILIIAENALLMIHYYRDYSLGYDEYNDVDISNLNKKYLDIIVILIIKIVLIIFTFIIWFWCKFILEYQRNMLFSEEKSFIFRKAGEKDQNINNPIIVNYFQSNGSLLEIMNLINKDIDLLSKFKILIFDTILFNLDINIFVFSFLLNILFLILGHPIILSIETLFIVAIYPSLLNIFKSFTSKFSSIFFCLIFTYLIVYVYNWISIFFLKENFYFNDVYEYKSGKYISEPFCHSSLQCLLMLISYGTRVGGGIGDSLPFVSYKNDMKMFIGRFIYDMTFFILVIKVMGNVTFGLIVDTFGELRDETYNYENDKNNICFICQLSRDGCLLKNIDFNLHIKQDHNLWNYVNFLVYLHLNNPNDFSRIEGIVWDKLLENDYGWIPIDNDAGGGEDDDEDN